MERDETPQKAPRLLAVFYFSGIAEQLRNENHADSTCRVQTPAQTCRIGFHTLN
jgi:hypothetical protein